MLEVKKEYAQGHKGSGQKNIFYDILTNDQIRPQDKETERLVAEAMSVVGAGYTFFQCCSIFGANSSCLIGRTRLRTCCPR